MKKILLLAIIIFPLTLPAQKSILAKLKAIKGISAVQKEHAGFKEYYELTVEQPLDHFNKNTAVFQQQVFIGFNNIAAPVIMETEGYAAGPVSKPQLIKDCNYIVVEHRYCGKSAPEQRDWNYLTMKQAANDLHHIRELFGAIFKGKWMTTGISKGGQTAIAYKMYFPQDADATLAYVTPIKNSVNDPRLAEHLKAAAETGCGKKVFAFQQFAFRHKAALLKQFDAYVKANKHVFSKLSNENVFEYLLLEYPFAFAQNCFDCKFIPDTASATLPDSVLYSRIVNEIVTVVPPRFYSERFRLRLEPSFYMFYHELGYYEYDLAPFRAWLSTKSYPNNIFAPDVPVSFDPGYLADINKFINDPATANIIFIYGENDPYTALQPALKNNKNCFRFIVKNGCHKSRITDLDTTQQKEVFSILSGWLSWPVGN